MAEKKDFTDRTLKAIKPAPTGKRVILYDAAVTGFGIRITDKSTPQDVGSFVLVARFPGSTNPTPRRIGDYPAMTLATARQTAREWKEDISKGVDPRLKEQERQASEKRRRANTFDAVFATYAADHLVTLKTGKHVEASIRNHVSPAWGGLPLTSIKRADVKTMIAAVRKTAPVAANRVLAYVKTFLSWCVEEEIIEASPATNIKRPVKESRRERVLTHLEIRAIWAGCGEIGAFGAAFKLMLLTLQRRSEVGGMEWAELSLDEGKWTIPGVRTKNGLATDVPLSTVAAQIVEACPKLGKFVLSTGRSMAGGNEAVQMSGWSKAKARLDEAATRHLQIITGDTSATLAEWHLHDLRRTGATYIGELGTDRLVISKLLNHTDASVSGIYDRFAYFTPKRIAIQAWADRLDRIVNGEPEGNVVSLGRAA